LLYHDSHPQEKPSKKIIKPREVKPVVLPEEENPIKAKSVDVVLSEELTGSLRLAKFSGDIAKESFHALKKRGLIEKGPSSKNKKAAGKRTGPGRRVKYLDRYRD